MGKRAFLYQVESQQIAEEILLQCKENAKALGVDPEKIIISGGSAGANLVSVLVSI